MSNRLTALLCLVYCTLCLSAQEVQRAVLFGAGVANTYDTYLSPLEYRGPQVSMARESFRMTHWKRIATQGTFTINALYTNNHTDNANEMGGSVGYRQSWLYTWEATAHWSLFAGGGAGADIGFLYNVRNSANNPAQALFDVSLHATVAARYQWRWLALRAQAEAPFMGLMFSPRYGQSYYEIFGQGHSDHNVVFTHPANCPTLRTAITADIRIPRLGILRLGYGADLLQSKPNGLRRHTYTHTGYVGYVRRFKLLK